MPLIPQQDVVVVNALTQDVPDGKPVSDFAADLLRQALDSYPPCRIVSITHKTSIDAFSLIAVVETI